MGTRSWNSNTKGSTFAMVSNTARMDRALNWLGYKKCECGHGVIDDLLKKHKKCNLVKQILEYAGRKVLIISMVRYYKVKGGKVSAFYMIRFNCGSTVLINSENFLISAMSFA